MIDKGYKKSERMVHQPQIMIDAGACISFQDRMSHVNLFLHMKGDNSGYASLILYA